MSTSVMIRSCFSTNFLDRRLSGKVHIDVHFFSCRSALCKCVERALVDKCVKALLNQLITQTLCRALLAAAHIFAIMVPITPADNPLTETIMMRL